MYETAIQSCFNVVSYGAKHTTYTCPVCGSHHVKVVSYGAKHTTYTISHACEKRGNGKKARPKIPAKAMLRQVLKITFTVFFSF